MMSKKRIFGLSTVTTLLLGAGVALYAAPGVATSTPTQAGSTTGRIGDPAPQRFEVAQAQTGTASTLPGGASCLPVILDRDAAFPESMAMRKQETHSVAFSFSGVSLERFTD